MNKYKFGGVFLLGQIFILFISFKLFGQMYFLSESKVAGQTFTSGSLRESKVDILKYTGSSFSGAKFRDWKDIGTSKLNISKLPLINIDDSLSCERWAVVTTIFGPSDSVKKVAQDPAWCLVIVGDKKTPSSTVYLNGIGAAHKKNVVYLSTSDQDRIFPLLSKVIPWNEMARKNIGYMYAVKHGANMIWDFDDDNMNIVPADIVETTTKYRIPCDGFSHHLFNTYPYFDLNETYSWPRGFPLEHIRTSATVPKLCTSSKKRAVGVVQSLANLQPDVDAVYRFTRDTPCSFGATPASHLPVMVPQKSYTPFNAQATLWMKTAFRYLAFPISVNYRISDIWRAYVALYFFHKHSLHLLFVPPYIDQYRNAHDYLKDFNDELDIYQKSNQLLKWLSTDLSSQNIQELYRAMFERGYLHELDLHFMDAWIKTFESWEYWL